MRRAARTGLACGAALAGWALPAYGQQRDTTTPQRLAPVVTVTRETARSPLSLPFAISSTQPDSARPGQRHTRLDETLLLLPGVTVANRNNPTQDPRISIRGFGARSAFGVRGVRVLRDGMPLTLPDGQTPVDYLDLESVGRVEVIRGSAAALYGNASGGVIDIHTAPPPADPFAVQARGWGGNFGYQRWTALFGGTSGRVSYQGDVSRNDQDGYRTYSHQRVTSGYGKLSVKLGRTDMALQVLGFDMPLAENPGALTRAQLDSAPAMADPLSVRKRARKTVSQVQVGLSGRRPLGGGELSALVYGGTRDLFNPLTFAIVDFDRASYGAGIRFSAAPTRLLGLEHRLTAGLDAQRQNDDRQNHANCNGVTPSPGDSTCPVPGAERGVLTLDQREIVSSIGPYVRDEIALSDRFRVDLGVRADYVKFEVQDHLITATNPDDSGDRTLDAVSPMIGFLARLTPLHSVYANISTAFETPTATELGNQPSGAAGLNPDLKPQYSTTYELGLKGLFVPHLQYDLAIFDTEVRDELIPFEIPGGNGRSYYRNAGRTRRRGLEVGVNAMLDELTLGASYSLSRFRFREFVVNGVSYAGNSIPGIPTQQLQLAATWRRRSFFATAEMVAQSRVFVDDANSATSDGFAVINVRLGATALFDRPWLSPVFGVQNLFDERYAGSVNINATGGKFYEPAPGRTVYGGLAVALGR
jgi:iron complex outermembrane receptor protein